MVEEIKWIEDKTSKFATGHYGLIGELILFKTYWDSITPADNEVVRKLGRWKLKTYLPLKLKRDRFLEEDRARKYCDEILAYFWSKITNLEMIGGVVKLNKPIEARLINGVVRWKIGDFTVREIYEICKQFKNCSDKCPFYHVDFSRCMMESMFYISGEFDQFLNVEIDLEKKDEK